MLVRATSGIALSIVTSDLRSVVVRVPTSADVIA